MVGGRWWWEVGGGWCGCCPVAKPNLPSVFLGIPAFGRFSVHGGRLCLLAPAHRGAGMRAMRERSHRQTAAETFSWAYPSPTSAQISCARRARRLTRCERRTALWRVSWGARWNAHSRHQLDNHVHGVFPLPRPRETPTRYRVILYAPASLLYHVHVSPPLATYSSTCHTRPMARRGVRASWHRTYHDYGCRSPW